MDLQPLKYFDSLYPPKTREREFKLIIPYLEKGLSTQLVGIPGCGKSNVLRLLSYNRDARYNNYGDYEKLLHFVYLDCSEVNDKSLFEILKFILISLSFSLGERRMMKDSQKINGFLKEGLSGGDELMLFQSLKKSIDYLSIEKKLTVNLLFDKFESIIPSVTPQFFNNLNSLRNRAKYRFGCIFSLIRPLEELLDPSLLTDFHDLIAGNIVYVSFRDDVWLDFRASYIEKAARKKLDEEQKRKILELTGGHSRLSKLSFEAIVTEDDPIENIEEFLKKRSTIQKALHEIWHALLPAEQLALKENVIFEKIKEEFPYLSNTFLRDEKGITIPLFESFIKNIPVESTELLSYDEGRNEIYIGDVQISDRLSPSEFRLLRYLIQNKGKICTKDEIITATWSEQKSLEGVTDQALDQIFYRLRKKVEKDPANPHYIQTLKGTGYKLA